jgi:hypothetical protein
MPPHVRKYSKLHLKSSVSNAIYNFFYVVRGSQKLGQVEC